jgi:hypothetical protein
MKPKSKIHINPAHRGLLTEEMGFKEGTPIPLSALRARMAHLPKKDVSARRRVQFAENARHFHHA